MARPTRDEEIDRSVSKSMLGVYNDITEAIENERGALKVKEIVFANLVAEQGYTYTDAYVESHKPETKVADSIYQMASRIANKPRVRAEIERVRQRIAEEEMSKEQRLAICMDGQQLRERMAIELFAMATSPSVGIKEKHALWITIGKQKHVNAFVNGSGNADDSKIIDIAGAKDAGEARRLITDQLKAALSRRLTSAPLDLEYSPDQDTVEDLEAAIE